MMWQMWTAFGAALELLTGVVPLHIGDGTDIASCSKELGNLLTYNYVFIYYAGIRSISGNVASTAKITIVHT